MTQRQGKTLTVVTGFSGVILAGILVMTSHADRVRSDLQQQETHPSAEIAVEHDAAITLTIEESEGKKKGIIDMRIDGPSGAAISLPSSWERREVRGAPLTSVPGDAPSMGFVRWHLPPGVTLSLWVTGTPDITVRHPSPSPLLVIMKRVNVLTGKVTEKSVLVKQESVQLY